MEEITLETLNRRYAEYSFLVQHHEMLAKHYSREQFNAELAIQQASKSSEPDLSVSVDE